MNTNMCKKWDAPKPRTSGARTRTSPPRTPRTRLPSRCACRSWLLFQVQYSHGNFAAGLMGRCLFWMVFQEIPLMFDQSEMCSRAQIHPYMWFIIVNSGLHIGFICTSKVLASFKALFEFWRHPQEPGFCVSPPRMGIYSLLHRPRTLFKMVWLVTHKIYTSIFWYLPQELI